MQVTDILLADSHCDLDGHRIALRDDTDFEDAANRDAFESHRRSILKAGCVIEVGTQRQFGSEYAAGRAAHKKNEPDQHGHGCQNQGADFQLGPLNLFSAWHWTPLAICGGSYKPLRLEDSRRDQAIVRPRRSRSPWRYRLHA